MFSTCANPLCRAEFDYRQGAIFRFCKQPPEHGQLTDTHSVQHFWLCTNCAGIYRLEYEQGRVFLRSFVGDTMHRGLPYLIVAA